MKVYARKLFPHDLTHEVSVKRNIVEDFFEKNSGGVRFKGKKSGNLGVVTINDATDPRFGGDFKSLLTNEGKSDVNDILLMYKLDSKNYILEIVNKNDDRYIDLMVLFRGKDRHAFLESDDEFNLIM